MTDFFKPEARFFESKVALVKPYALMDLDDTLFQTQRKIAAWQLPMDGLVAATVDKQNAPLSFLTPKQRHFFNWLSQSTELIPVTARDTTEIMRVKLPFDSWQVLTHGAVIVAPSGQICARWQRLMAGQLVALQAKLAQLMARLAGFEALRITPHYEHFIVDKNATDLMVYVAIKHQHKDHDALLQFAAQLPSVLNEAADLGDEFYIHVNANNLAILPHVVNKHHAMRFLLDYHLDKNRPCFGFGDSLADLPFLQLLDWYGTPNRGQLHDAISQGCL